MANIKVVTTTTDLASVVKTVGGKNVDVESIAKGTQDPHFIEAKPSYMVKLNRADLVVVNGLDLEIGWMSHLLQGARNPRISKDGAGYLDASEAITPIEIPTKKLTRAEGDVHPFGNPHYMLSPENAIKVSKIIEKKLSELKPELKHEFGKNQSEFEKNLNEKIKLWKARVGKTGIKSVITYHKTLNYFLSFFSIQNQITLEPKPGIPPTSQHILKVIEKMRQSNIKHIFIENFFDTSSGKKIRITLPQTRVISVPVQVDGEEGIKNNEDLYEKIISLMEKN